MVLLGRLIKGCSFEKCFNSFLAYVGFRLGNGAFVLNVSHCRFFSICFRGLILDLYGKVGVLEECEGIAVDFKFRVLDTGGVFVQFLQENFELFLNQLDIFGAPITKMTHENVVSSHKIFFTLFMGPLRVTIRSSTECN
jgi:hypothetical protein